MDATVTSPPPDVKLSAGGQNTLGLGPERRQINSHPRRGCAGTVVAGRGWAPYSHAHVRKQPEATGRCPLMTNPKTAPDDGTLPSDDTPAPPKEAARAEAGGAERIAKRLARAGLCSRRDAERWIADGRVAVNGAVLTTPAVTVGPTDVVVVDGNPLPKLEPTRLWRYHKPDGLVTTARDEKGRQTVFDVLPADLPRVISVGRLDLTTEGLLLLTNDGELARYLELPTTGWARRYRVRVNGF